MQDQTNQVEIRITAHDPNYYQTRNFGAFNLLALFLMVLSLRVKVEL